MYKKIFGSREFDILCEIGVSDIVSHELIHRYNELSIDVYNKIEILKDNKPIKFENLLMPFTEIEEIYLSELDNRREEILGEYIAEVYCTYFLRPEYKDLVKKHKNYMMQYMIKYELYEQIEIMNMIIKN